VFERAKTEFTAGDDHEPVMVFITEDIQRIIDTRGNKDKNPNNYIFPVLRPGMNPLQIHEAIKAFIRRVNKEMAKVCEWAKIEGGGNTKMARKSAATCISHNGASREFVKSFLGHTEIQTADHYIDNHGDNVKKKFARKLTSFKKKFPDEKNNYS
jgi:integrase/recombinase XerD